ncbi:MAG TPA: hypothetical protein VI703_02320 [Anaerolineales bacterium]|nr:hypothetical protein [Anaerolineales bacterium]
MANIADVQPTASPALTQKRILLIWLPLAASWLLMALESPYISAALARLSEAERMIAAFGLAMSLSITIESPVISLLATSTALARSRQNYLMLRRFTLHLMLGTTLLQFLLAWTPVFDLVVKEMLGVPASLLAPVRLGLQLMLPWSAAIAWRRFRQGIMIRYGYSGQVGRGTVLRLLGSAGTATVLGYLLHAPGIVVGATALSVGVTAEALYAHLASARVVKERFSTDAKTGSQPDLGYGELVNFHWPLATSNLLFLFTQPMIAAALARSSNPELNLAAWPVLNGLLFITRAPEMALPEVTIALNDEKESQAGLRRFAFGVGATLMTFLALVALTPLSDVYFHTLIGVTADLSGIAKQGAGLALLMPLALSFVTTSRGLLTARRNTRPQALAMAMELLTLAVVLVSGVILNLPGVPTAALGMSMAMVVEAIFLWVVLRRGTDKVSWSLLANSGGRS